MEKNADILWGKCLQSLQQNLTASAYQTWFAPLMVVSYENNVLVLQVKSQFVAEYIEDNYLDILSRALREVFGAKVQLEYHVSMAGSSITLPGEVKQVPVCSGKKAEPVADTSVRINQWDPQLNLQYTFQNFVKGEPNKLARAAGVEIAKKPGKTIFNPLFIFGGSGVGKTHLATAIGNYVVADNPSARVLYVTANTFKLQFQDAVSHNHVPDFLLFYQSVDVLIVDDIQFFAELKGTQDSFFQIFNYLQQSHKQLILTSDCSPMELKGMQERLLSRFKWGLSAEILPPDYTLRRDILLYRMRHNGIQLDADIVEYIATNVHDNVRDLEGVLASLMAYSTLTDHPVNLELAKTVVARLVSVIPKSHTVKEIMESVCKRTQVPQKALTARSRQHEAVRARNIFIYMMKKLTDSSLAEIGSYVHRDHATVAHSLSAMSDALSYDILLRQDVAAIEDELTR